MLGICALLAAVAVGLFVRPPVGSALARLDAATSATRGDQLPRTRRRWTLAVVLAVASAVVAMAGGVVGPAGSVVAVAAVIGCVTVVRMMRLRRRSRSAAAARTDVAHACRVLAGQLRVGRVPTEALRTAAGDCPVLGPASALLDLGASPLAHWRTSSMQPGHGGLLVLARAWEVSTRTGAPLAPALERVSEALSEDVAIERLVFGEVSAARATGKMMAALPLCGIGIGYAIGGHPLRFLVSGPLGWACLLGGVTLAAVGVLWIDWLSRSVLDARSGH